MQQHNVWKMTGIVEQIMIASALLTSCIMFCSVADPICHMFFVTSVFEREMCLGKLLFCSFLPLACTPQQQQDFYRLSRKKISFPSPRNFQPRNWNLVLWILTSQRNYRSSANFVFCEGHMHMTIPFSPKRTASARRRFGISFDGGGAILHLQAYVRVHVCALFTPNNQTSRGRRPGVNSKAGWSVLN